MLHLKAHNKRVEGAHLSGGLGPRLRSASQARRYVAREVEKHIEY